MKCNSNRVWSSLCSDQYRSRQLWSIDKCKLQFFALVFTTATANILQTFSDASDNPSSSHANLWSLNTANQINLLIHWAFSTEFYHHKLPIWDEWRLAPSKSEKNSIFIYDSVLILDEINVVKERSIQYELKNWMIFLVSVWITLKKWSLASTWSGSPPVGV